MASRSEVEAVGRTHHKILATGAAIDLMAYNLPDGAAAPWAPLSVRVWVERGHNLITPNPSAGGRGRLYLFACLEYALG